MGKSTPWLQGRRLWLLLALLVVIVGGLASLWVKAPDLYNSGGAKADAQATATATTRAGILAVFAATIAALGAVAALVETRKHNRAENELQREAQVTGRYTEAISQLGAAGPDKVQMRLGGIYALHRIALDSRRDRIAVYEVLCSFVRNARQALVDDDSAERRLSPDVHAAVVVITRLNYEFGDEWELLDLSGAHLEYANLHELQLQSIDLRRVHLEHATLTNVSLMKAVLADAHLEDADLFNAILIDAKLERAHLERARLSYAHLKGAGLSGANLEEADLSQADLGGARLSAVDRRWLGAGQLEAASLRGTRLAGASFESTRIQGVDLSQARGLAQVQVDRAIGDEATRLPRGLTRPHAWASRNESTAG